MMFRIATAATLVVGSILLCLPAQAQTGMPNGRSGVERSGVNNPDMNNSGTAGSGMSGSGMDSQTDGSVAQGRANGRMNRSGRMGNMNERQMTECLNNASAQGQSLGSCQR